ncbi:MAG: oxidoreductase-like domain-containing protein [Pseudomonadota bacterium]|nr:oxidoreductase-like domain-containing protein [Pseudomonadota bacterium]
MPDPDRATSPDPPPQPPPEPDPADCCGEGCVRCIWDLHDEAMERYRARLAAWKARHPGR